ncbi:MAG: HD domain-containing protein [Chloroflexales bacterium]|nr:HD domain-containing protein [Chloroflexales bacterium]
MIPTRLRQQIDFIIEIDKLKSVMRRTYLADGSRRENSAEHSWQLAMMAVVLAEHANVPIDLLRVIKMVLVHDIVEIDAGDTYIYDTQGALDKAQREQQAADRIFALLPAEQARELHSLWEEFEARETPDARFAAAMDRLMPLLHNYVTAGRSWQEHGITSNQVLTNNARIDEGSETLWELAASLIADSVAKGYLAPAADTEDKP